MSRMDRMTEQSALLVLLRQHRTGWAAVTDEVETRGSAYEVLVNDGAGSQPTLFADEPTPDENMRAARTAIHRWTDEGIHLVTLLDDDYPKQLLTIHERPPFLLYRGSLREEDADGVAIVGTRKPSSAGLEMVSEIARDLARRDVSIISGLAAGIDTAAHRAALEVGGRTVGVIGTGLEHSYPSQNAGLQAELGRSQLVVSQFWPNAGPTKKSFPMRNAVMSGYAAATVVVEAAAQSGSRIQARLALQHGRPVFLLESLLEHDWARDFASKPGTRVVSGPADIIDQLADVLAPPEQLVWAD